MNNRFPIKIGPGIVTDETVTAINTGNWADASLVRFWRGLPQTINGWEANTSDTFSGICRGLFAWRDNAGLLNIAIGTVIRSDAAINKPQSTCVPSKNSITPTVRVRLSSELMNTRPKR